VVELEVRERRVRDLLEALEMRSAADGHLKRIRPNELRACPR
jgi:hypothetical protein